MKNYTNCPVCNHTTFNNFLSCKDYTVSKENFNIVQCEKCNFTFTNPIPLESEIGKYYESEDYISHSNTKKGVISSLYQTVRNYTLAKKMSLLKGLSKGENLLDIGSGTGEFLNISQKNNFVVQGIEPSDVGRKQAKDNFDLDIHTEDYLKKFKNEEFDFITMWHVLEHVYHLNDRIVELHRLIKEKGHVIIAVPNLTSLDSVIYKEKWAAYDVPRHLYHFSPESIQKLFNKHGFTLQKSLPMKFDSFYVSMLSEKYKTGKVNLFSAFLNGLKSNLKGDPSKTFSSQIYIFQKSN